MAEAFLQVLLENLSSLIEGKIGLIMGVEKEMRKLSSTLTTIQAVLEDAEEKQFKSKPIRNWLCKLNDLAYEIDDVLDKCATEVSKLQHKNNKSNHYSLKKILNRRKIGRRMKEVANKLDAVAAERTKFHLRNMVVERQSKVDTTRETGFIINEPDFVYGRDEEKEKIVDILVNHDRDSQQLSILPIIGIGGLGKTTLAQLVYNDPRVTEYFDTKLWVCVSDNFDLKTLVKAMIEFAIGSESAFDDLDAIQYRLSELLNQKRYLLILDDVWNDDQEKWDKLKYILACGSRGASIVVTTRLKKVADIMGTLPAHHLSGLSEEHCWLLFRQHAFGQEMEEHPNLEAIGKEIVKKCAGVALAAKALGGLLRFKREEKEWIYVKESEIWNLPHEEALILPALRLSYQHLPLKLRQCFAYCAVFPKDAIIEKEELIFRWMAHGYISSNGISDVEDVGNEVWNELVLRSLFQDVSNNYKGKTTFKMHDLVYDLAQSIMQNKVPGEEIESSDQSVLDRNKIRQVNLGERYVAFPRRFEKEVNISYTLKNFNRLRMLDASQTGTVDLPSKIGKLKRLRYLNLSNSFCLHTLPDTICSLWNLKILNLNGCERLVYLPNDMRYMKNLSHILLEGCSSLSEMPPKIGELTSLKTLSLFVVGHEVDNKLDELQCLDLEGNLELKHLERVKNHSDAKKANIGEKSNLRHLVLQWEGDNASEQQEEMDEKVLEGLEPHPNVEKLWINGFKGRYFPPWTRMDSKVLEWLCIEDSPNCLRLPPLGDLRCLKRLSLSNLAALEYIMENEVQGGDQINAIFFPSLEYLILDFLPNLKGLLKEEEVGEIFPKLQKLYISLCPLLKLPSLSSLKELRALGCNNLNLSSFSKLDNLTSLEVTFDNDMRTCIPKETLENLSNLKKLVLENANEHTLPIEGLKGLKSLKELHIRNCDDTLTCLPDGWLRYLTALERLSIYRCKELVEFPEGIKFLHSLKHLELKKVPKMVCPPEVLQHVPSLSSLDLTNLPQLASLPDVGTDPEMPVDIILEKEGYMRDCILYCSLFPADYEFTRGTLIWSWLAAGIINPEQNGKREALAISCFDKLRRSNFIFHSGYDHSADQMRYKVGNEKNIFLNKEYLNPRYRRSLDIDTNVAELEHLSLIFEGIDQIHFEILRKCRRLKTLLLHQCHSSKLENLLNGLFLELKVLTTLDLSCTNIMELPSSVENLKALQYLDMSKTPIRRLPESIESLGSLETLTLMGCLSFCGLPKCMYKLINLQHLVLDISSMPIGIGNLTNLQTLRTFLVGTKEGTRVGELRNMNKLKGSLCIMKLGNIPTKEEAEKALMCDKKYLTKLELIWSDLQDTKITLEEEILESLQPHFGLEELRIVSYSGGLLPSWISDPSFTQISNITLDGCRYCEKLPSLGDLPSLKFLNIVEMDSVVEINNLFCRKQANGEKRAFPQLEKLSFDGMCNLEKWTGVEDGDFPCLEELMIKYCPKLVDLPSLSYLVSLQHLEITDCPELPCLPEEGLPTSLRCLMVKDCPKLCKEQGEDWINVVSVPTLYIDHQRVYSN